MPGRRRPSRRACSSASGTLAAEVLPSVAIASTTLRRVEREPLGEAREDPRVGLVVDVEVELAQRDAGRLRGAAIDASPSRRTACLKVSCPSIASSCVSRSATISCGVAAVGAEDDGAEVAGRAGGRDDRAGAVAEQRRGVAVGGVDVARHDLRADDQRGRALRRLRASRARPRARRGSRCRRCRRRTRAALGAPSACATWGAAFGITESWLQLATSTRSTWAPSMPASASAAAPAARGELVRGSLPVRRSGARGSRCADDPVVVDADRSG